MHRDVGCSHGRWFLAEDEWLATTACNSLTTAVLEAAIDILAGRS